jgi:uncharacterized protein YlzI (FlbEa/FlbD family)
MAFIELTDNYGNKIAINAAHICTIIPYKNSTSLTLVNNEEVVVRETPKEILKKIL